MEIIIKNLEEIPNSDLEAVATRCQEYLGDKIHQIVFWHMGKTMDDYEGGGSVTITTDKIAIVAEAYNYDGDLESIFIDMYLDEKEIHDMEKIVHVTKNTDLIGKSCFSINTKSWREFIAILEAMSKIKSL